MRIDKSKKTSCPDRSRFKTLSAGVAVCRQKGGKWLFLLLCSDGFWDFPKGIVEQGEDPVHAAIRETEEETTINDLAFRWGYASRDTGPYNNRSKIARYYIAETGTETVRLPVNPEIGKPEHDAFAWADYETAMKLAAPRVRSVVEWAHKIITSRGTCRYGARPKAAAE